MDIFGSDLIIGDFKASDYNLTLGSTDYDGSPEDEEMGNNITIAEQFIGRNPVPVYLDYTYTEKLKPTATLIKLNCHNSSDIELSEFEVRGILRLVTGYVGYKWMKVITYNVGEDIWYKAKVVNTSLVRINGRVVGIKLFMECDSQFGYSPVQYVNKTVNAYEPFQIFNHSDEIYANLLPTVKITMKAGGNFNIVNKTENNRTTIINNVVNNEVITINSEREIIESTAIHQNALLDDFNLVWIRFLSGMNEFYTTLNCNIEFTYRLKRKGGFVCR